jgi:hypothetical protein
MCAGLVGLGAAGKDATSKIRKVHNSFIAIQEDRIYITYSVKPPSLSSSLTCAMTRHVPRDENDVDANQRDNDKQARPRSGPVYCSERDCHDSHSNKDDTQNGAK